MRLVYLFLLLAVAGRAADEPEAVEPAPAAEIVQRYVSAVEAQRANPHGILMDMDIDGQLPRLKKRGRLHALRFISRVGQIFYDALRFEGDNTVKKEVIGRYLQAEKQARSEYAGSIAITPANYKFKYKGSTPYLDRTAHIFQLTPRKKRVGLFKGELWVDSETYLPLREWGELVKNPSVFLKSVYFVRDYHLHDGIAVPRRIISNVDTRLVGRAELTIWFNNYALREETNAGAAANGTVPGGFQN